MNEHTTLPTAQFGLREMFLAIAVLAVAAAYHPLLAVAGVVSLVSATVWVILRRRLRHQGRARQ